MNTLDDLRASLDRHAADLDDRERYIRPVAVRERVRVVRRRRSTVAAVAAAAVVVAGVAGMGALRHPDHADPAASVVGVDVPSWVSVTGFPYEISRTATFPDSGRLRLDADASERAISLVGDGLGAGSATLYADGEAIARARGDQDLEAPVPTGATTLRVRLDGAPEGARAGVAVYEATGALAPGVADPAGDAVFRDTVAGDRLVVADFSDPGEAEISVTFTGALSDIRFADYCTAEERGLWINIEIDHEGPLSGQCRDATNDPGASGSSFEGHAVREWTVRAYLTRGVDGPRVTSDTAVFGVAVYRQKPEPEHALGMRVAPTTEYAGRTWVLERTVAQPPGSRRALTSAVDTADGDRLIGLVGRGTTVGASWKGRLDHGTSAFMGAEDGPASTIGGVLLAGDRYDVTLDSMNGSDFDGVLLIYRPV